MRIWIAAAILLALTPSVRAAQEGQETAREMQSWCQPIATAPIGSGGKVYVPDAAQFCWGAFAAIQQLGVMIIRKPPPILNFCAPPDASRVQMVRIFLRYAEKHPAELHLDFASVALHALVESFPCTG